MEQVSGVFFNVTLDDLSLGGHQRQTPTGAMTETTSCKITFISVCGALQQQNK